MRLSDFRSDVSAFSSEYDSPAIVKRVHQQSARNNPKWKRSLVSSMKKYGFELVGNGINGAVFSNPKYPYALKVYRSDWTYDEWVYFSKTHSFNKYVPRFKGNTYVLNSVFKAIRMELLFPADTETANHLVDKIETVMYSRDTEEDPDLLMISKFMKNWEGVTDLTAHNIMARSNGELVIIDPLYHDPNTEFDY